MVIAALRASTKELHRQVESRLVFLVQSPTLPAYMNLLRHFYGFYTAIEHEIAVRADGLPTSLRLAERRKAWLLAEDLLSLGDDAQNLSRLPVCLDLPSLDVQPRVLGCLYVLEGATLGGRVISRSIGRALGLGPGFGGAFFGSYGEDVDAMWASFLAVLSTSCKSPDAVAQAVEAACETFAALDRWLERSCDCE